jgi:hypothetical protein
MILKTHNPGTRIIVLARAREIVSYTRGIEVNRINVHLINKHA